MGNVGAGHCFRPHWRNISGRHGGLPLQFLWIVPLLFGYLHAEGNLEQQAQAAWQERDKPGQTEQAIRNWEQTAQAEPERADLWISLAKAMGRAVRHSKTSKERRDWADRARAAAGKAVEKAPASSDAYAVYGEALGQWAEAHKGVHSLKAVRQAVDALKRAVSLDPKNAYAHMLLASFYREAPGVISVGDKAKALEHARLAVEYGPEYAINHLILARVDLDRGQKEEAIEQLQAIAALTPPTNAVPETLSDQETARAMLKELGAPPTAISCGQLGGYCSGQEHL